MPDITLITNFQNFFSVNLASTAEQKKKVFGIRYRVYCEEFKYEPAHRFPEKMEYDTYDSHSLHCLITHKKTQMPAACVRLVPTTGENQKNLLPYEKYCWDSLDHAFIKQLNLDRDSVCEISRLAVDGFFRRRSGENQTRYGDMDAMDISQKEKRTFMLIAVAAFLASTALTDLTGKTNVFAMMEPFLPRMLNKSGISFLRTGKEIDYHGLRAPYFIKTQSALESMHPDLFELYQWVKSKIESEYNTQSVTSLETV